MNEKDLYRIVGEIADDLIVKARSPAAKVRRIRVWKIAAAAVIMVAMLGTSVWAAAVIIRGSVLTSKDVPDYVSVPSPETLRQDIGIEPHIIEKFSNGYIFKDGNIMNSNDIGENGNIINFYKELSCNYYNGKNDVSMYVFPASSSKTSEDMEITNDFNGSEIGYKKYTAKVVPNDYQLTEQDKADQASGKYVFSYGSDEIEIVRIQFVRWEYGGIGYILMEMNGGDKISKEELADMAEEMISFQTGGGR